MPRSFREWERQKKKSQKRQRKRRRSLEAEARAEANRLHKTFQSVDESPEKGWMRQHIVNKVLSLFGG